MAKAKKTAANDSKTTKVKKLKFLRKRVSKQTGLMVIALAVATCMLVVSGAFWWNRVFMDPDKVFQSMLANNLSSISFSKNVKQDDGRSSVDQTAFVSFQAPDITSETRTILGERSATSRNITKVTTETIGTKDADYVRYVSAEGADNLSITNNLSKVFGVWASRNPDIAKGESSAFLNEAVFSIVPYGNLTQEQRSELINYINQKNLYQFDESKVQRSSEDGRYIYTYDVNLHPATYIDVLKKYSELTGVGDTSQLDSSQYQNAGSITLRMKVDILSRQLISVQYPSSARTETYPSRNLIRDTKVPTQTIPFEQLQNLLTGGQQSIPS